MNNIQKSCIEKNVKLTNQRKIIATILSNSTDHPDVKELYCRANKIDSKISIATVYRTLNLFEQYGLIKKLDIGEGKARYEEFKKTNEHFHLVDIKTGNIVEFKNQDLKELKEKIAKNLGYKLINSKLELYGTLIKKE